MLRATSQRVASLLSRPSLGASRTTRAKALLSRPSHSATAAATTVSSPSVDDSGGWGVWAAALAAALGVAASSSFDEVSWKAFGRRSRTVWVFARTCWHSQNRNLTSSPSMERGPQSLLLNVVALYYTLLRTHELPQHHSAVEQCAFVRVDWRPPGKGRLSLCTEGRWSLQLAKGDRLEVSFWRRQVRMCGRQDSDEAWIVYTRLVRVLRG